MGELSSPPPLFSEPPSFFFFLIPQTSQPGFGSDYIITKIHSPFQNPGSAPACMRSSYDTNVGDNSIEYSRFIYENRSSI